MVEFAALIFIIITAPLWLGLLLGLAVGALFLAVVAGLVAGCYLILAALGMPPALAVLVTFIIFCVVCAKLD